MARYVVVAHQTALSTELREHLKQLVVQDPSAEFVLLVPATPVGSLMVWEEGETHEIAERRAAAARQVLEEDGINVAAARVGDYQPLQALMDDFQRFGPYDGIILSTFPPGVSRWLRLDLVAQMRRKFPQVPLMHVMSQPRQGEQVIAGRRYETHSLQ